MLKLNQVEKDKECIVLKINNEDSFKRRILDIGLVPGTKIIRLYEGITKGISAYEIRDSLISIRDIDASRIEVKYV